MYIGSQTPVVQAGPVGDEIDVPHAQSPLALQVSFIPQAFPHAPQFMVVVMSVSQPFAAPPEQSAHPMSQLE